MAEIPDVEFVMPRGGFVQEGVHSGLLCVGGEYHDCLYMARPV